MLPSSLGLVTLPAIRDAEDVTQTEIEEDFGGATGIHATKHYGKGMLPAGGRLQLTVHVAGQPVSGMEPAVALDEQVEHILPGKFFLTVRG